MFQENKPSSIETLIIAKAQCSEFLSDSQTLRDVYREPGSNVGGHWWRHPLINKVKINSDAHFEPSIGKSFSSVICRDHEGGLLTGDGMGIHERTPLMTEALVVCHALIRQQLPFARHCRGV